MPIHISNTPWQELKRLVEQVAKRKRIKDVSTRRNYLEEMEEFDNEVFNQANSKRGVEEISILQYIMSGAWFQSDDQIELGMRDSKKCSLCGENEENITHTLWGLQKTSWGKNVQQA